MADWTECAASWPGSTGLCDRKLTIIDKSFAQKKGLMSL